LSKSKNHFISAKFGHSYHCLFCDGYERRGQAIGILGASEMDLDHTLMTFAFKPTSITVFTDGAELNESSMGNELRDACARGCVIDQRIIHRFSRTPVGEGLQLHFDDGTNQVVGFLIYHPRSISRAQHLFDQLGIEPFSMQSSFPQPQLPFGQLSVPGAFMAGDVATPFKIVSISAASG
jgi:gliotoxin/aspirochlorine biosynthesis thioredoxin reductase